MNRPQVLAQTHEETLLRADSRWVASLAEALPTDRPGYSRWQVAGQGRSRSLYLSGQSDSRLPICAQRLGIALVLDGSLYNRRELQDQLGNALVSEDGNDAELILAGYQRWGEDILKRLRGAFALLIWDCEREVLLCLRDPLGTYPLFYADGRGELLISTSVDLLIRQPHVSAEVNRAALMDHLVDRYPRLEETCYQAVSRVPPGHVLRVTGEGRRSNRYWDPSPDGQVKWLAPDEVEQI